jgi:hypothetical protein
MPNGHLTAFFLFEVGDAIDLEAVGAQIDVMVSARLAPRPATPPYVQYQQPPLTMDGAAIGLADVNGFRVRLKAFDYGVISVAFTRELPEAWDALLESGLEWQEDGRLEKHAERLCRELLTRIAGAVTRLREGQFLSEDYFVFTVYSDGAGETAEELLSTRGSLIAQLLRNERQQLSSQEREEVLRHRLSYYISDVVVATWNSALVYDSQSGAPGVLEILEFANSQLLEFRYYDHLLDVELARTYAQLQRGGWRPPWIGRRYARTARQIHALFIDVNELTDKAENALKIAGDVYAARLFGMTAARLGLEQWKGNVREKLKTVDDIYRFAVEHTAMARGEFLETIVVILILLELVFLVH